MIPTLGKLGPRSQLHKALIHHIQNQGWFHTIQLRKLTRKHVAFDAIEQLRGKHCEQNQLGWT
jgi:hypothetical protein